MSTNLVNDWATPLGVFGGFYLFAAYLYLEGNVNKMKSWPFGYAIIAKVLSGTFVPLVSVLIQTGMFTRILLFLKPLS